jgi:hypothetical protein
MLLDGASIGLPLDLFAHAKNLRARQNKAGRNRV